MDQTTDPQAQVPPAQGPPDQPAQEEPELTPLDLDAAAFAKYDPEGDDAPPDSTLVPGHVLKAEFEQKERWRKRYRELESGGWLGAIEELKQFGEDYKTAAPRLIEAIANTIRNQVLAEQNAAYGAEGANAMPNGGQQYGAAPTPGAPQGRPDPAMQEVLAELRTLRAEREATKRADASRGTVDSIKQALADANLADIPAAKEFVLMYVATHPGHPATEAVKRFGQLFPATPEGQALRREAAGLTLGNRGGTGAPNANPPKRPEEMTEDEERALTLAALQKAFAEPG